MKKQVKIIALITIAVLAIAAVAVSLLAPLTVAARAVQPETATLTFTEQGSYDYDERRTVYPLVAGEVLEVRVREGDTVEAGDVLAVVSASDYLHQIEQLKSGIAGYSAQIAGVDQQDQQRKDELVATLENLNGQMLSLQAEKNKNKQDDSSMEEQIRIQENIVRYQRDIIAYMQKDRGQGMGDNWELEGDWMTNAERQAYSQALATLSQSELMLEQLHAGVVPEDIYEGQVQSLQAQIDSANEQLLKSYSGGSKQYYAAQITAAEASIRQMEEKAGQAEIVAPIAGVVSELPVREANVTAQQASVATIGAGGRVEVFVPIREIDGVKIGDKVELILDKRLGKDTLAGTVAEIDSEAKIRLSALGVEERKVRVLVTPDEPALTIGFDMDVRFTVYTRENALTIPKTALFSEDGADYVWVIADGRVGKREITKGIETRDGHIVDAGLAEGDVVVTDADNADLREGRKAKAE